MKSSSFSLKAPSFRSFLAITTPRRCNRLRFHTPPTCTAQISRSNDDDHHRRSSSLLSSSSSLSSQEDCQQCSSTLPSTSASQNFYDQSEESITTFLASFFKASPHDGAIFSLALPAVLALAADPLLQVVDTIFVGQAGSDALAALGVNSALFTFSFVVFNFLATATTPLVATALATGDKQKAGTVTIQALLLATALGVTLTGGLTLFSDQALILMGADPTTTPEMFSLAKDFLLIRALAAPAVLLMTVGQGVFRGLSDMRTPLSITLTTNAVNFALDTVLILGLGWGVKGAATATSVAEWLAAIAYVSLLYSRRDRLGGLNVKSAINVESMSSAMEDMAPFLAAGGAVLMRTALLLGTKTLASATAARLGPIPIAAHQVVMQLWLLSSLIIDSLAVAGQTLVAVDKGKGDISRAREVSNRLLQFGIGGGFLLAGGFWAAEPFIPHIFTNDAGVAAAAAQILPLAVAMLPINAAVYVFDGILVGSSDFKWMAGAMTVAAASAVGLLVGVDPLELGLQGVWIALAVLMTGRLGTLIWRYQSANGPLPPPTKTPSFNEKAKTVVPMMDENNEVVAKVLHINSKVSSVTVLDSSSVEQNVYPVKPSMEERLRQRNNKNKAKSKKLKSV